MLFGQHGGYVTSSDVAIEMLIHQTLPTNEMTNPPAAVSLAIAVRIPEKTVWHSQFPDCKVHPPLQNAYFDFSLRPLPVDDPAMAPTRALARCMMSVPSTPTDSNVLPCHDVRYMVAFLIPFPSLSHPPSRSRVKCTVCNHFRHSTARSPSSTKPYLQVFVIGSGV